MNTQLATHSPAARPQSRRVQPRPSATVVLRSAGAGDSSALHALIHAHLDEGHLLPRTISELTMHADRFVVAVRRGRIVGCAELAPLSGAVAEVRSLVVDNGARSLGIGGRLVEELRRRARIGGFQQLCAFAHDAAFFVRMGFSIVPHTWVPEKIARDCTSCTRFRRCGQHALVQRLADANSPRGRTFVPLSLLRG